MGSQGRKEGEATTGASESGGGSEPRGARSESPLDLLAHGDADLRRLAALGEMAACIIDQLNGPLALMTTNLEQLALDVQDERSRSAARAAHEGLAIIRGLARDVLLLACADSRAMCLQSSRRPTTAT